MVRAGQVYVGFIMSSIQQQDDGLNEKQDDVIGKMHLSIENMERIISYVETRVMVRINRLIESTIRTAIRQLPTYPPSQMTNGSESTVDTATIGKVLDILQR
jgi:hypothetical protein